MSNGVIDVKTQTTHRIKKIVKTKNKLYQFYRDKKT